MSSACVGSSASAMSSAAVAASSVGAESGLIAAGWPTSAVVSTICQTESLSAPPLLSALVSASFALQMMSNACHRPPASHEVPDCRRCRGAFAAVSAARLHSAPSPRCNTKGKPLSNSNSSKYC